MTGLSKCCGVKIYEEAEVETPHTEFYHRKIYCSKCHKQCEVEKKELSKKQKRWRNLIVKSSISYNWDMTDEKVYQQIKELIKSPSK